MSSASRTGGLERHTIVVEGIVQGVGFRPFVQVLATRWKLAGSVQNQQGTVLIDIEGVPASLEAFWEELPALAPPLARITAMQRQIHPPCGQQRFQILTSQLNGTPAVFIPSDAATCPDCLRELFDPADRRYLYPFINCANCGPRLTIIKAAPYDRARTTMAGFDLCPACHQEYTNPANRRFHAEPIACANCGPHLELRDAAGSLIATDSPIATFAAYIQRGQVGALKGIGGFHLVCDARNEDAVQDLRRRKGREEKPLAVMLSDLAAVEQICRVSRLEADLLRSPSAPIVLLRRLRQASARMASAVAPHCPYFGLLLPYSPLHHLLMYYVGGIPLVMTSGNCTDEPMACNNEDAVSRLSQIADLFLLHNRPIHVRCDDSVTRVVGSEELPLRRSRGYAPQPIELQIPCSVPILAVGGQFKSTFAFGRDSHIFLSHHLGDLDHFEAYDDFQRDVALYRSLFQIAPRIIAHDLHPEYSSTRFAMHLAEETGVLRIPVQHHHAHLASCLTENGLNEPAIGVIFDGTGFGIDEQLGIPTIWGGEFLIGDLSKARRAAHLRNIAMPGGDAAIREPWRMAAAYLQDANCESRSWRKQIKHSCLQLIQQMLARRLNCPLTSSMGRLFDAVASLIGACDAVSYEGQAATELEWLATNVDPQAAYPFELSPEIDTIADWPATIDCRPLIQAIAHDVDTGISSGKIARGFHATVTAIIFAVCQALRRTTGIGNVALSGGVFQNSLLLEDTIDRLEAANFRVYRHRLVPPNDGGLALGQVAIAAAHLRERVRQR